MTEIAAQLERRRRAAAEQLAARRPGRPHRRRRQDPCPRPRRPHLPIPRPLRVPLPDRPRASGRRLGLRPTRGLGRLRRAGHPRRAPVGGRGRRRAGRAPRGRARRVARAPGRAVRSPSRRGGAAGSRMAELEATLRSGFNHVRRQKDAVELERMRVAERATRDGFAAVAPLIEPGRASGSCRSSWRRPSSGTARTPSPSTRSSAAARTRRCCTSRRAPSAWRTGSSC